MKGFDLVQSIADGLVDRGIELVIPVSYTHLDVYKRQPQSQAR